MSRTAVRKSGSQIANNFARRAHTEEMEFATEETGTIKGR